MKLTVIGRNIKITEAIKSYLDKKSNKTFRGISDDTKVHISLHVQKNRHIAAVTAILKGFTAHAGEETENLYKTIDKVLEKIKKQLDKYKN